MINAGTVDAHGCSVALISDIPVGFFFQATDPTTNVPVGTANTPVDIPAGENQTFVLGFVPTTTFPPNNVQLTFRCLNSREAVVIPGVNTVLLSVPAIPVPDTIALVATSSNDGIVSPGGPAGSEAFAVASANVGADGRVTVSASTGLTTEAGTFEVRTVGEPLPVTISLCETNPATSMCKGPLGPAVVRNIARGETPTFAVFVTAHGPVPFDPGRNRIFVQFTHESGLTTGSTSVAVRTE